MWCGVVWCNCDEAGAVQPPVMDTYLASFTLLNQRKCSGHYYHPRGGILPASEQALYLEMFESVCDGDLGAVTHMVQKLDGKDALLACMVDAHMFTPLVLAVYRGHAAMAALLLRTAAEQFTPYVRVANISAELLFIFVICLVSDA